MKQLILKHAQLEVALAELLFFACDKMPGFTIHHTALMGRAMHNRERVW